VRVGAGGASAACCLNGDPVQAVEFGAQLAFGGGQGVAGAFGAAEEGGVAEEEVAVAV
jgi:hypothetical protein